MSCGRSGTAPCSGYEHLGDSHLSHPSLKRYARPLRAARESTSLPAYAQLILAQPSMKVFLSSTAVDLVAYRQVADDTILRLSQSPW